ncbi:MAG TPA: DUF5679 domain-containing protein [Nitrososphaerales archaeon]|nr:DUF5679 domain-containing protein [Nitrososphaerales archaeon]
MTDAFCVKCRTKRPMIGTQSVTFSNGRHAVQGSCPICATKLYRIGG